MLVFRELESKYGIHCNMTLLFSFYQVRVCQSTHEYWSQQNNLINMAWPSVFNKNCNEVHESVMTPDQYSEFV